MAFSYHSIKGIDVKYSIMISRGSPPDDNSSTFPLIPDHIELNNIVSSGQLIFISQHRILKFHLERRFIFFSYNFCRGVCHKYNDESQIGWIFKSKANVSYCLYDSGPMVRHYALWLWLPYVPESVEKPL